MKYLLPLVLLLAACDCNHSTSGLTGETSQVEIQDLSIVGQMLHGTHDIIPDGDGKDLSIKDDSLIFFWRMNDGTITLSKIPLNKIRFEEAKAGSGSKVKFRWVPASYSSLKGNIGKVIDEKLIYAVIITNMKNFQLKGDQ